MNEKTFVTQSAQAISLYLYQELKIRPGIDYRAVCPAFAPRATALELVINPSYIRRIAGMVNELSSAVGLDGQYTIRVRRGTAGRLILEIPKPKELWRPVGVSALRRRQGVIAPLGLDMTNHQTVLDLSDPLTPHVLICGGTGSGKSNSGRLLAFDLALQNDSSDLGLILIDTKKHGKAWADFGRLPHLLHPVITDEGIALQALAWGVAELDRRSKERRDKPRLFFGIDEAQSLLDKPQFVKLITDLAGVGREWGLHLGLLVQNPTAETLSDVSIKRNIQARLVGKVDSATAATVATGMSGTGAELLTSSGDMLLVSHGDVRRLTTALVTQKDIARLDTVETVKRLDLGEYEDIDHVIEVASVGRNPDPLEPIHVYSVLVNPEMSQNELYRRFNIGRAKQKAVIEFAQAILHLMALDGYSICRLESGTERNGIPVLTT